MDFTVLSLLWDYYFLNISKKSKRVKMILGNGREMMSLVKENKNLGSLKI
jgi:hypothetical protein